MKNISVLDLLAKQFEEKYNIKQYKTSFNGDRANFNIEPFRSSSVIDQPSFSTQQSVASFGTDQPSFSAQQSVASSAIDKPNFSTQQSVASFGTDQPSFSNKVIVPGQDIGNSKNSISPNNMKVHPSDAQYVDGTKTEQVATKPSSTIQSAAYWIEKQYLVVSFKSGATYDYQQVPLNTILMWERAPSAGSFFYYNIRTSFKYSKVG